jgi:hypothetical protein
MIFDPMDRVFDHRINVKYGVTAIDSTGPSFGLAANSQKESSFGGIDAR